MILTVCTFICSRIGYVVVERCETTTSWIPQTCGPISLTPTRTRRVQMSSGSWMARGGRAPQSVPSLCHDKWGIQEHARVHLPFRPFSPSGFHMPGSIELSNCLIFIPDLTPFPFFFFEWQMQLRHYLRCVKYMNFEKTKFLTVLFLISHYYQYQCNRLCMETITEYILINFY